MKSNTAEKRMRLVNQLLARPEFADFWALKWGDLLRSEEKQLDRKGVHVFHEWIRRSLIENRPLNEFAADIVRARGSTYRNPPANFYRANRSPVIRAENAAQVFLAFGSSARSATIIRSIAGRREITTIGPPCLLG